MDASEDLDLALKLADIADAITSEFFQRRNFTLSRKADRSEVTQADQETERALVSVLEAERPTHGIFGEEFGDAGVSDAGTLWVLDPIDGTSNFTRGIPVWATLISLVDVSVGPILGVVSAPSLQRRWWAIHRGGAFADGRRIRVSDTPTLAGATASITINDGWEALGLAPALIDIQRECYRSRNFGDFWQHMLVAEGAVDFAIDAVGLAPYDNAAVQIIVEEAGGRHTDRHGTRDFRQNTAISSNGLLHEEVIARLTSVL